MRHKFWDPKFSLSEIPKNSLFCQFLKCCSSSCAPNPLLISSNFKSFLYLAPTQTIWLLIQIGKDSLERQNQLDIYRKRFIIRKLAEKFHNLHSASQRPRKASDKIQFEYQGLKTRGTKGRRSRMLQLKQSDRKSQIPPSSTFLFCSGSQPIVWHSPTLGREPTYWVYRFRY